MSFWARQGQRLRGSPSRRAAAADMAQCIAADRHSRWRLAGLSRTMARFGSAGRDRRTTRDTRHRSEHEARGGVLEPPCRTEDRNAAGHGGWLAGRGPTTGRPAQPLAVLATRLAALGLLAGLCITPLTPAAAQQAGSEAPGPVPVTTARVTRQDVPIFIRGIGTVQAFQSVQVRARVDGTLMKVAVQEGQDVNQGELIAVIAPRPGSQ